MNPGHSAVTPSATAAKRGTSVFRTVRIAFAVAAIALLNFAARNSSEPETRGGCLIFAVLLLQLTGLLPLYCIGLLVPVFATLFQAIPGRTPSEIAHECFGSMFNPMTAVVLGSFTVNAICLKCCLDTRLLAAVARRYEGRPYAFQLALMLGCMFCSSFVLVTLLALAAVRPLARKAPGAGGASLILGVGIACTLGGVIMPISGPSALILLSVLAEYGVKIDFLQWVLVGAPTMTVVCVAVFAVLVALFGPPPSPIGAEFPDTDPLSKEQVAYLGFAALFLLGCLAESLLAPVIGDVGNLGLLLTALSFGSGFLSKRDFLALPWDLLALLFGVNTLSFVILESGLARSMASTFMPSQVYDVWLWMEVLKLSVGAVTLGCVIPHAVVATLALPVVVAFGIQLYAPTLVALLTVFALVCGVGTPYTSSDMIMAVETMEEEAEEGGTVMTMGHFVKGGVSSAIAGLLVVLTVGYGCALGVLGVPPVHIIIKAPEALKPTIERWDATRATEARIDHLEDRLDRRLEELESSVPSAVVPREERTDWGRSEVPEYDQDDRVLSAVWRSAWGVQRGLEPVAPGLEPGSGAGWSEAWIRSPSPRLRRPRREAESEPEAASEPAAAPPRFRRHGHLLNRRP